MDADDGTMVWMDRWKERAWMNVWMIGCTHGELDEHMNV